MFIEIVDAFRCPRPHELQWLVASVDRLEDRDILTGELGCPVCGARYPIVDGVADFRPAGARTPVPGAPAAMPSERSDRAIRAAALLGLTEPSGIAVLAGAWGDAAHDVAALVEGIHVLAVDPLGAVSSGFGVSVARAPDILPMRPESTRAIALDDAHAGPAFLESSAAALKPSGRLVVAARAPIPAGIVERARDAHDWLGEKQSLTTLARASHS